MADALKPCPCCGGEAKMEQYCADGLRIQCRTCALKREQRWLRYGREWLEEKMIAAWNHRALPAPAGEPEMPELSELLSDWGCIYQWDEGSFADVETKIYDAIRAWGDARAEHARRVAMEEAALIVDAEEDDAREERYHPGLVGALSACAAAIRAAALPQGEQTCSTKRV